MSTREPVRLKISRVFDAPRALVFSMWTSTDHMRNWFGPKAFEIVSTGVDFRPGGAWHAHIRAPSGSDHHMSGVYQEIVEDERIVFTHAWRDETGEPGLETIVTFSFADEDDGRTRLTFEQEIFETVSSRDSHEEGWSECLDRLTGYLPAQA